MGLMADAAVLFEQCRAADTVPRPGQSLRILGDLTVEVRHQLGELGVGPPGERRPGHRHRKNQQKQVAAWMGVVGADDAGEDQAEWTESFANEMAGAKARMERARQRFHALEQWVRQLEAERARLEGDRAAVRP